MYRRVVTCWGFLGELSQGTEIGWRGYLWRMLRALFYSKFWDRVSSTLVLYGLLVDYSKQRIGKLERVELLHGKKYDGISGPRGLVEVGFDKVSY
jgi:hypothetical protein